MGSGAFLNKNQKINREIKFMNGGLHDLDILYIHCDAAMDYDSQNSGGVGFVIIFPDFMGLKNVEKIIGRYVGANINV